MHVLLDKRGYVTHELSSTKDGKYCIIDTNQEQIAVNKASCHLLYLQGHQVYYLACFSRKFRALFDCDIFIPYTTVNRVYSKLK